MRNSLTNLTNVQNVVCDNELEVRFTSSVQLSDFGKEVSLLLKLSIFIPVTDAVFVVFSLC